MPEMKSGWREQARRYLIKRCLFSLMQAHSLGIPSEPRRAVLWGNSASPLLPASWSPQESTPTLESGAGPAASQLAGRSLSKGKAPNSPVRSGSDLAVWGGCQDSTRRGARGTVCQSRQVAAASSGSESRSVFPAVKTARGGGSQCCPRYPTYRHCYK